MAALNEKDLSQKKIKIHVNNLWKSYGNLEVLKGLTLDVYEGETLVILGRSGVGKSVLLKQIIGIEEPDQGYVEVDGKCLAKMPFGNRYESGIRIGMLFQGAALFDSMDVQENIAFYLNQHEGHLHKEEIQGRVQEALKMVGLINVEKKMPSELSGGMRKRAALARLIVYAPSVILYDEPTTGLDPVTGMQINDLINKTQLELNATSVVVTHDIRSALEIGDRLAFHHEGRIAQIAPKKQFMELQDPEIRKFFENAGMFKVEEK